MPLIESETFECKCCFGFGSHDEDNPICSECEGGGRMTQKQIDDWNKLGETARLFQERLQSCL